MILPPCLGPFWVKIIPLSFCCLLVLLCTLELWDGCTIQRFQTWYHQLCLDRSLFPHISVGDQVLKLSLSFPSKVVNKQAGFGFIYTCRQTVLFCLEAESSVMLSSFHLALTNPGSKKLHPCCSTSLHVVVKHWRNRVLVMKLWQRVYDWILYLMNAMVDCLLPSYLQQNALNCCTNWIKPWFVFFDVWQ